MPPRSNPAPAGSPRCASTEASATPLACTSSCTAMRAGRRIDVPMIVRLSKTFHFEAAHDLPTFPADHKCRRLHGHSFRFDVVVEGEVVAARGYLIDYGDIRKAADPL